MLSVGDTWERYRCECDAFRDPASRERYARRIRYHWNHLFPRGLDDVKRSDVRARRAALLNSGRYARSTCNWAVALLGSLYKWANYQDLTTVNPCRSIEGLKVDRTPELYLPDDELLVLLKKLDHMDPRSLIRRAVVISLNTGMRKGELLALKWEDIDFRAKMLTIRAEHAKNRTARYVPLNQTTLDELRTMQREVLAHAALARGLVFRARRDPEKPTSVLGRHWRLLQQCAGLHHRRWHVLRHQYATNAVRAGESVAHVQACLGHASLQQTMVYAHQAPEHLAGVAAAVDTRFLLNELQSFGAPS